MSQPSTQFNTSDRGTNLNDYKFVIIPVAIFVFLILLVTLASYFNYNTYFFKVSDNKLQLWHGDFAPLGFEVCNDFEAIPVGAHSFKNILNKRYSGKERAYGALYSVFISEAEEELENGCDADIKKVDDSMALADRFFPVCYRINPGFARKRFEVSWKKVETLKDLLSVAYKDSLEHLKKVESLGVAKDLAVTEKEKEASNWLKDHPLSP